MKPQNGTGPRNWELATTLQNHGWKVSEMVNHRAIKKLRTIEEVQ